MASAPGGLPFGGRACIATAVRGGYSECLTSLMDSFDNKPIASSTDCIQCTRRLTLSTTFIMYSPDPPKIVTRALSRCLAMDGMALLDTGC